MKRALLILCCILFLPVVAGNQIASDAMNVTVQPDGSADVVVERTYSDVRSQHISYLVPARYTPSGLQAADADGQLDCTVEQLDVGTELLCTPRGTTDYTVTIRYAADMTEPDEGVRLFSYARRVMSPTDSLSTRVELPEGYGLVDTDRAVLPEGAAIGTEGRNIHLHWEHDDVSIGETIYYSIRYEELGVFSRLSLGVIAGMIAVLVFGAGAVGYYLRRDGGQEQETIAAVFPVLKDDEQEVIRYIVDHDGEVEQRDIVADCSFSKAKVSKLLSDLEDRNMVEKQKQGRVNIVSLARDIGDMSTVK